jgi:hypothetical protein
MVILIPIENHKSCVTIFNAQSSKNPERPDCPQALPWCTGPRMGRTSRFCQGKTCPFSVKQSNVGGFLGNFKQILQNMLIMLCFFDLIDLASTY